MLNVIEMFERLAYFGIRAVVPLYIMQATEPGGLHLTAIQKGWIYAWWAVFQSFLPIITGGIADRYGYKRVLALAISANAVGYLMMANLHSYYGFFAGVLVLASGTAFFKPALQGSLAQNLTKANASVGWGIFYWVVNVGAFAAPFVSTAILGKPHSLAGWKNLFYTCAGFTCINLLVLLTFRDVPSGADKSRNPLQVLWYTVVNIFELRLIVWLLIMSCFWLMMYQLWDLHPNFITDWVDSSMIAEALRSPTWPLSLLWEYGDRGLLQVPQQILLNLNAGLIVLLVVFMSWVARRMRTLSAMLIGMSVATLGVLVAGWTMNGWVFLLGVVFFSLGEMWTGPKKNEYLALIAPPGKKGLYLGYVNIPVGVGVGIGSYLGGWLYDNYGEKATLALKELGRQPTMLARAAQGIDWSDSLELLPGLLGIERSQALTRAAAELGQPLDVAKQTLRAGFRYDSGQTINLGLILLAEQDSTRSAGLGRLVAAEVRALAERLASATASAPAGATQPNSPPESVAELRKLAARLDGGELRPDAAVLARYVHLLPGFLGIKRFEVLEAVRQRLNEQRSTGQVFEISDVSAYLWECYGENEGVLNNLALEFLAQETYLVRDAVERAAARGFGDPVTEIPARFGIDRTKSFGALSLACGADTTDVLEALQQVAAPQADATERLYLYLIGREHVRFTAIGKHDWTADVKFLEELIAADPGALEAVRHHAGRELSIADIARNTRLVQIALGAKDWTRSPAQAAQLLGLNPFEARARVAAEINDAAQLTTIMLWEKYKPNRGVWLPIVGVGIGATIALGVFGQLAKRWQDMNA